MPIKGTPLENLPTLKEEDILRTVAFFRYINPLANIRLAAGRRLMKNDGEEAFKGGASATITGNMLTTSGSTIASDKALLTSLGRDIVPEYLRYAQPNTVKQNVNLLLIKDAGWRSLLLYSYILFYSYYY